MLKNFEAIISKVVQNKKIIFHFLSGQFISQFFSFIISFFILRWLTVDEQAKYTFVTSLQNFITQFTDLGVSGGIIALVGVNYKNKEIIGRYISAAFYFRHLLLAIAVVLLIIGLPFVLIKHNWPLMEMLPLVLLSLVTVYFLAEISIKQTTFQLNRDVKKHFQYTNIASFLRLVLISIAQAFQLLNTLTYLFANLLSFIYQRFKVSKESLKYYSKTEHSINDRKEIIAYIKPLIPISLFLAFQGQISVFLISYFGNSLEIAEVGALNRIGQFFVIFSSLYGLLVNPFIARLEPHLVKKQYVKFSIIFGVLFILITVTSFIYPTPFILYLGKNFNHLAKEISLYIVSLSLLYYNNLLWGMNISRRWQKSWFSVYQIVGTLIIQIIYLIFKGISSVDDILYMNIINNLYLVILQYTLFLTRVKKINPLSDQ